MRRVLVVAVALVVAPLAAIAACADTADDAVPPVDAASGPVDGTFATDTGPAPSLDADIVPGDVCGDRKAYASSAPWPLVGGCATRAGWSPLAGPQTSSVTWSLTGVNASATSPAVTAGSVIWVGTTAGDILAVNNSGVGRWALHTSAPVRSSAALDIDGNAVVAGGDGVLYGVNAGDGPLFTNDAGLDPDSGLAFAPAKVRWRFQITPSASSPVIGPDGTIYVGTLAGKLWAVAARGVSLRWVVDTHDAAGSSPAIGQDGTIYVGSSDHHLYALHPDGSVAWTVDVGAEIHGSPAVGGDGTIYIGSADGQLHAVTHDGALRWAYATGGDLTGTPAVYAGTVYVGSADQSLHAVSVVDGTRKFAYATLGAVGTPVIGPDGTVYVGSADTHLYAISSKGTLVFAANAKGRVHGAPAIAANGALYLTTENGAILIQP